MGDFSVLAIRIKKLRTSMKMTQKEFSAFVGCTAATLSAYENGSKSPSLEIIKEIAEKCHISIDWICGLSDRQYIVKNSIWTYSDIIEFCFADKIHIPCPSKAISEIISEFIKNMQTFLKELEHMEQLRKENMIDQELFDLWLEKTIKKFQIPIVLKYERHGAKDAFTGTIYAIQHYPGGHEERYEIKSNEKSKDIRPKD